MNKAALFERVYDNSHRAAQAAQTRVVILDALVRVLARGVAELSIPAVAQEAGVSVRTVYRNFPAKRVLLAALNDHLDSRIGFTLPANLRSLEELLQHIRDYFLALEGMDEVVRAARLNPVAQEARHDHAGGIALKHAAIASAMAPMTRRLAKQDRTRLLNVIATMFSQFTLQRMKDDLGLSAAEAADTVTWVITACIAAASGTSRKGAHDERRATDR
jgi:AcrR family transcriptional regulator